MNQVLHIFRKDARHHWPEILASIALLIAFVMEQPYKWAGRSFHTRLFEGLVSMLPAAMVLVWAFLTVRLVQSEALVGNQQFWITRPYEWHKLLAAKLLSILVFIHLPFFLSQIVLLGIGRFPLLPSIPGLLFVHVLFFIAIVVPSLTVGSITAGIGQAALAALAAFLVLVGLVAVMFVRLEMDVAADSTDWLVGPIYLSTCVGAIFLQYLHRRTLLTRLIAVGAVTLIALIMLVAPYEKTINGWFPLPANARPIPAHLEFDRTLSFAHAEDWSPPSYESEVDLEIPFEVSELDDKSLIDIRAIKLDLDLPDGRQWTSHWHSVYHHSVSFGRTHVWPDLKIKKDVLNSVKSAPVRAHVTLGMNVFHLGAASQILMSGNRVSIPGGARCLNDLSESLLTCFSALIEPHPMFVVAELPNSDCPVAKDETRRQWASSPAMFADLTVSSTPDLDFTPIQQFTIDLSRYYSFEDLSVRLPICSGTRLVINKPVFQYSVRDEIDLGEIHLADYHPTYPRKIIPPAHQPASGAPSDTLSWNLGPELLFRQPK
jgi:hypothetical protein